MTPTQLQERKKGVGGSDCASLFNVGYGCRRRLWYDKTDTPPDFEREETKGMALGKVLEPFFADEYAKATGRILTRDGGLFIHTIGQIRSNIDRAVLKPSEPTERPGVLEIKSVSRGVFYTYKRTGLPEDYILQLQHGMLATGWQWGSFTIGNRDNGDLLWWDVERNEEICARILDEAPKFWTLVEQWRKLMITGTTHEANALAPPRLEPDDRRCQNCAWRTTCQGNALISIAPQSEYEQDESLGALTLEYVERRALSKEAEDLVNETKAELQFRLGDRGMVMAAGAKIQYYEIEKKTYTVAAHKERPLRIYPAKVKR